MSIAIQCRIRAAYTASQRVMAPAAPQHTEMQKKSARTLKFSPAYTVEISDEARAKYNASRKAGVRKIAGVLAQTPPGRLFSARRTRILPLWGWLQRAV